MFKITTQFNGRDAEVSAKYELGQEVIIVEPQSYGKGTVTGMSASMNRKGIVIHYIISMDKNPLKTLRCPEWRVYRSMKEACAAIVERLAEESL